jgi:DNA mismatch endonuclease (patch repair protein)|tara:strand:+ start:378 stop:788 length:411 start_codon:yes stop_codon:yes gene_type:complete
MDNLSKKQRMKNMRGIKSKNTKPEKIIRSILFSKGYRFKIHDKKLPGRPDIVLPKHNTVVNVHGCYWHYHGCSRSNVPKTKTKYWLEKLENNKRRDSQNKRKLTKLGWKVIDVWECTLKRRNIDKTFDKLQRMIAC